MYGGQVSSLVESFQTWATLRKVAATPVDAQEYRSEASRLVTDMLGSVTLPPLILEFYARELEAISRDEGLV